MARRRVPPPPADDPGGPPAELRRFRYEDWAAETEPIPDWWSPPPGSPVTWSLAAEPGHDRRYWHLGARRRWMDAVRAWREEHGVSYEDWDQVRGACDATCTRTYKHTHGG